jgi:error-prone DNA polymerase
MPAYAELQVTSNYSFLRGASHIEELFAQASLFGLTALGITDRNSLAGIVRAHQRAADTGVRLVVGCRLDLTDGPPVLVYPTDRAAYARLCRLLTIGKRRAGKGACTLAWPDLAAHADGLIAVLLADTPDVTTGAATSAATGIATSAALARLRADFPDRAYLALTVHRRPNDAPRLQHLADLAAAERIPTVATGDVLYHAPRRRILQDVLTCIREGCTIDAAGFRRERFTDRHLKPLDEIGRLFARHPDAVARTLEITDRCRFSLDELRYQYPTEVRVPGQTPQQALETLTWDGAARVYPDGIPDPVTRQLHHELTLIAQLDYAPYFLTVHSIVRFAKSKGILCQGRGSAANSAVCYVLGITAIDPTRSGLLFERFVSAERREPPDIDVDFEHERREEVIQWVYNTYGRDRAALCATVIRYRARGAVREVGKALGLSEDITGALAGQIWGWSEAGVAEAEAAELNLNLQDRRLRLTLELSRELIGFPRHLSQHPGGFVLTEDRLDELVPIEPAAMDDRQVIEWDKDDIDALRFMKVDVLGLGMLSCMRRAFDLLAQHRGQRLTMDGVPPEDPATYEMIRHADTVGTFQIESRAQMSMLPRLKPRTFYDLVIQVAIVRPGPIQGDMVHPYLRRREGKEPIDYPTPELRAVLEKTLGVPLFQEQAMRVAIVCAGFSPGEADQLRRAMATFKFSGSVSTFRDKLIAGMVARGYQPAFAERTFSQIEGFGSYGFPESHAASFALIAYASSWMKCHHPDVFCCALLNAQPMGFYAPAQIVRDARQHGVEVRPVCANVSRWDCTLEPASGNGLALRLGLRMVKGLGNTHAADLIAARAGQPYRTVTDLWQRAGVPVAALERIAEADGFHTLGLDRRQALWEISGLADTGLPLFAATDEAEEPTVSLRQMPQGGEVVEDYRSVGLSLRRHPVAFLRDELTRERILPCAALADLRDGARATVAGVILVRQRPGSAGGVLFITIEDETGHANLIVWSSVFERQRRVVMSASMLACRGKVQKEGEVIHVVADHLTDLSALLASVGQRDGAFPLAHGRGDAVTHPNGDDPREPGIKVATRDFR